MLLDGKTKSAPMCMLCFEPKAQDHGVKRVGHLGDPVKTFRTSCRLNLRPKNILTSLPGLLAISSLPLLSHEYWPKLASRPKTRYLTSGKLSSPATSILGINFLDA